MGDLTKKQDDALNSAFNSSVVQCMELEEYKVYIQCLLTLSLGTVIVTEGVEFASEFVEAAINNKENIPVVQQVKRH